MERQRAISTFENRTASRFYFGWNGSLETPGPAGRRACPANYSDYNDLNRRSDVYRATWDHNFSPTLLNQFRGGGNDWAQKSTTPSRN